MKLIGIIGGIGPESTIEYYRSLLAAGAEQKVGVPPILINSIDMNKMLAMIAAHQHAEVTDYLVEEVLRLARAGAGCALIAAATPHMVFDEVQRRSPIPMVSLVEACCEEAQTLGLGRIGLFGTRFTMQGRFFPDVFSKANITLVVPAPQEQDFIHHIYFNELAKGVISPQTLKRLTAITNGLREREGIQALLLGGTELSLILRSDSVSGIPLLDATRIHVRAALAAATK